MGGEVDVGTQDPLWLRVLLDGSVCEVFTSTGTVLSIRTNRWGVLLGSVVVLHGPAREMFSDTGARTS